MHSHCVPLREGGFTIYISQLEYEKLTKEMMHRIIFENLKDDGLPGDMIFVFGSITAPKYRVPKAVELYNSNRANKIMMSGGQSKIPESKLMKETALAQGVPESDIFIEENSKNTKENILFSKELIDQQFGLKNINRIILVTNFYHLRRCFLSMKTFMPEWIQYSLCGVFDTSTRPDNWWTNEKGIARVEGEVQKLIKYIRSKEIIDCLV